MQDCQLNQDVTPQTCPISMETLNDPYFLECGHIFDYHYIKDHFALHHTCPLCNLPSHQSPKKLFLNGGAFLSNSTENQSSKQEINQSKDQKPPVMGLEGSSHILNKNSEESLRGKEEKSLESFKKQLLEFDGKVFDYQ